jgi:hypothetical protein
MVDDPRGSDRRGRFHNMAFENLKKKNIQSDIAKRERKTG